MKKMSDVFNLSKPIGYNANWSDDQVRAADKAIRMHDELVEILELCQKYVDADFEQSIKPCNPAFIGRKIAELLERCK